MASLTDNSIRKLKRGPKRQEVHDRNGLYVIVQPSGVKSFALRYRKGGRPVKYTLGQFFEGDVRDAPEPKVDGFLTLEGARKLASDKRLEIKKGGDPAAMKREAKQAKQHTAKNTFEAVALDYMAREGHKLRSRRDRERALRKQAIPVLGHIPIALLKKSDVVGLLDKLEKENGPVAADRCLAFIRRILHWYAAERSDDYRPPLLRLKPRKAASEQARDRVLDDRELAAVWMVSGKMSDPFAAMVRFLLLTAARRNEAARMPWSEIKGDLWTLPKERNKTKKELARPLSRAAQAVLPPMIEGRRYVFGVTEYSRPKRKFDEAVAEVLGGAIPNWRLHDLRRTARSLMSRAGVPREHAERCLGHVIGGVEGTYDRHRYIAEMQIAYELLARQIELIVNPPADNVLPFQKAGDE